jgi:phasin
MNKLDKLHKPNPARGNKRSKRGEGAHPHPHHGHNRATVHLHGKIAKRRNHMTTTNTTNKAKSGSAPEKIHDMTEAGAEQTKEFFDKMGNATTQAASTMQDCCSTALKGIQAYHQKLVEFTRQNTQSHFDFVQQLAAVKTPSEFFEMSAGHTQRQLEAFAQQTKELGTLAQRVAVATAEPVKQGLTKKFDQAA